MLELVSKLQTSSGRAALVDMYGAKHECADDAEMANDDDDVDANCCVPPAGTKVSLCKLAAHTVMNEQSGTIVSYSGKRLDDLRPSEAVHQTIPDPAEQAPLVGSSIGHTATTADVSQ